MELQTAATDRRILDQPLLAVAEYWGWTDAPARAKETFVELLRQAEEIGDESSRPYLLFLVGQAECELGDVDAALERGIDGHAAAEQLGQQLFSGYNLGSAESRSCSAGPDRAGEGRRRSRTRPHRRAEPVRQARGVVCDRTG